MNAVDGLRRFALGLLSPAGSRGRLTILTFHQVPAQPDDIAPGTPHADVFAMQMQWLSTFCNVLPLAAAAQMLRDGKLPARAACITFDDGYSNNLEIVAPILRRLGLPATFFITAGAIEQGIMWNDLVIEGVRRGQGDVDLSGYGFGAYRLSDNAARQAAIRDIIEHLKYQPMEQRWSIAESLYSEIVEDSPPRLMMTKDEVAELGGQGFDIGAHTINHPILKELSAGDARMEIEASRDWVADVVGKAPTAFAYPNGKPGTDFDASHEAMVIDAGFDAAVSTRWAVAHRSDSSYSLPRCKPWERNKSGYWMRLVKTAVRSYVDGKQT